MFCAIATLLLQIPPYHLDPLLSLMLSAMASKRLDLVQVYDGHSGRSAAEYARDQLLHLIAQQASFPQHLTDALVCTAALLPCYPAVHPGIISTFAIFGHNLYLVRLQLGCSQSRQVGLQPCYPRQLCASSFPWYLLAILNMHFPTDTP